MARIVLVEDDEILAEILVERLSAAGHVVSAVHEGGDALRAVDESDPDLLILDYQLPGVSGLEILRTLRRGHHADTLSVMMLTANSGKLLPARAHHDGADDYLAKPVSSDQLLRRVDAPRSPVASRARPRRESGGSLARR